MKKPTFGKKYKFRVPREAWYLIRYPNGKTETKLLKIGSTNDISKANTLIELSTVEDMERKSEDV